MLRIATGHSADYLLNAVATGRENYYTGAVAAGEPPGRWYGPGAAQLGLLGLVDAQDMKAVFEHFVDPSDPGFKDPSAWEEASKLGHTGRKYLTAEQIYRQLLDGEPHADAERREALRVEASKAERHNVAFLDATFSVQKSVTVLHTAFEAQEVAARNAGRLEEAQAWAGYRKAIEDGIWAGNRAMLDYLAHHAGYSRVGHHGGAAGRFVDAHDWVIASFFQHDSRDHDPQLHIHNPILNRVRCADGKWRTLDSKALGKFKGAAGALGERVMEEYIARVLGVEFRIRPDGKAREVVGVQQAVMDLFSSRSRAITPKTRELVAAFEAKFGRPPNRLERDRLAQQATLATRRAKTHDGQSREQMLEGWDRRLRAEIRGGLASVAHDVLNGRGQPLTPTPWSPVAVLETALAAVQEKKSGWTAPDLTREISNALPDHLGITDGHQMAQLLDRLTEEGLKLAVALDTARPGTGLEPAEYRLADGRSVFEAPAGRLYATPDQVHTERILIGAAADRTGTATTTSAADRFLAQLAREGVTLGSDQAAAVRGVLTAGARVSSLIGPAGTGKSFVVGTIARAWTDPTLWGGRQQRVIGLATSETAADILAGEGLTAANTTRWLAAQTRLADNRGLDGDARFALRTGDLVVIDESSMADTTAIEAVRQRAHAAGAELMLVGDYAQLGAIGAGGVLEAIASTGAISYELAEARRFSQPWERDASLRLRAGGPTVLEEYHKHGRLIDAGTAEQAEHLAARRWLSATLEGRSALLLVDSNEQAGRINSDLRAELIKLGRVTEHGVALGRDGNRAGVGDIVTAKRLAWELVGHEGNTRAPRTSERYRVLETRDDGSLAVAPLNTPAGTGVGERMVLPADYVARDLTLGYAVTEHGGQGQTVDEGFQIATPTTRAQALYPGATRGRHRNTLIVVTQTGPAGTDAETGDTAKAPRKDPRAVLGQILENARRDQTATTLAAESAAEMTNVRTPAELFAAAASDVATARTAGWLDDLTAAGVLTDTQRKQLAAEDAAASLGRMLRRAELAGHDPRHVLTEAITSRELDGARQLTNVLHDRIARTWDLDPTGDTYTSWTPHTDRQDWRNYLNALAAAADRRRDELGAALVAEPPAWALEALGPVPQDPAERLEWQERAGRVAAHRELTGHEDPDTAIGPAPAPGMVEAHASWRAAWRALGRPDTDRDEASMSDGQLRMRIRAYQREQAWAPRNVTNELAGTIQAADHHRSIATRRAAEADTTTDPTEQARLRREAVDAAALVDTLEQRIDQLREMDQARGLWLAHTAGTRAAADRAQLELANRRAADEQLETPVTAEEWLAAHDEAMREDDRHREITPADLTDTTDLAETRTDDRVRLWADPRRDDTEDVREVAAREPDPADEHTVHVPTAEQNAESIRRAHRALDEIRQRDAEDAARAEDEARAARVARWQTHDHDADDSHSSAEREDTDRDTTEVMSA